MFTVTRSLLFALAAAATASAHMQMTDPAPLQGKDNPNTPSGSANFNLASPMGSASVFPCNVNGLADYLKTDGGKPVSEWAAGSQQSFTIGQGAVHEGGSCQASLSEDGGSTWKVMESFVGNCPVAGKPFSFTVPKEAKSGDALFGWSWFNKVGNREMYMNCASITITGGGSGLSDKPDMFVANVPGVSDCTTPEGVDIDFVSCGSSGGTPPSSGSGGDSPAASSGPSATGGAPSATGSASEGAPSATGSPSEEAPASSTGVAPPVGTGGVSIPVVSPTAAPTVPAAPSSSSAAGGAAPTQAYDDGMYHPETQGPGAYGSGSDAPAAPAPSTGSYKRALRRHARDLSAHRH